MKAIEALAELLKREGTEFLSCYPYTPLIEVAAAAGIRPIVCRQERVGAGIADGFSRVSNGKRIGVFAMQQGPGAENAFSGVTTAFSDSTPVLVLPAGYPREQAHWPRYFSSERAFNDVTKSVEQINVGQQVPAAMRRAFSRLRNGRGGPVMLELPIDVGNEEIGDAINGYLPAREAKSAGDPQDVDKAAQAIVEAQALVIHAGQGVLYAEATEDLVELADLLQAPVMTTLLGKSGFPEDHPLSLGPGYGTIPRTVSHFMQKADVVLGVGCSFARHAMAMPIPPGKALVHVTNDEADINRNYGADYPVVGDAKLVLRQLIAAVRERLGGKLRTLNDGPAAEIATVREAWLTEWMPKLTSDETPINPYRVVWELNRALDPAQCIVKHDSGSPGDQMMPFYRSSGPRTYLGWCKSHALGTGLGLAIGAKLAAPEKVSVNWMGDSAFGMVGLDFETAVRCQIPIVTIVSNNYSMAIETPRLPIAQERFGARDVGGNYADVARALGGYAERVESPGEVGPAIQRARRVNEEEGRPALIEVMTGQETAVSRG